jgi:hypothetical protein
MIHCRDRSKQGNGIAPVVLLLWLTIAVALLSALVPQGLPASRVIGSAFSPATTGVALKARASQPIVMKVRVLKPEQGGSAGDAIAIMAFCPSVSGIVLLDDGPRALVSIAAQLFDLASFRHARAPPVFTHH